MKIIPKSFGKDLNEVLRRIQSSLKLLDAVTADVSDLYSKVNKHLRTDLDRLYLVLQQCYDVSLQYLEVHGVDIHQIKSIPTNHQDAVKNEIDPFWRAFQHSLKTTLKKYSKQLPKLDQDLVGELHGAASMTTSNLLKIFNQMLKGSNDE